MTDNAAILDGYNERKDNENEHYTSGDADETRNGNQMKGRIRSYIMAMLELVLLLTIFAAITLTAYGFVDTWTKALHP